MASPLRRRGRGLARLVATGTLAACSSTPVEPTPPTATIAPASATAVDAPEPEPVTRAQADAIDLEALRGGWRSASNPPAFVSFRFAGSRYITDGYPTWQESGRIELLDVDGRRLRVRFVDRIYDGNQDEDEERWIELAEDGRSFVMAGRTYQRLDHDAAVATEPEQAPAETSTGGGRPD